MLAAKADYETGRATIGTRKGTQLSLEAVISALESIGYGGELVEESL
ncbi:MAG: hypothetical protein O3B13_26245 [Planctomycetota bacterium]|nr:hypothetical protein [Planctomycetota bacterium]